MLWVAISSSAYDFEVDGIYYTITSTANLTCEVSGKSEEVGTSLTIPEEVSYLNKKLSVTSVGYNAFSNSKIEYLKLPRTVKSLLAGCFRQSNLKKIEPLTSVTYFGVGSFQNCKFLDSIAFGASDEKIHVGVGCFKGCTSLKKIFIPSSVILDDLNGFVIDEGHFEDCKSLEEVTIDCEEASTRCFKGCSALTKAIILDNCKVLGYACFSGCTSLKKIVIPESIVFEEEYHAYNGENIFLDCTSLEEVTWNANVIPLWTFKGCKNLTKLIIGDNTSAIYLGKIPGSGNSISTFNDCNIQNLKIDISEEPLELLFHESDRYSNLWHNNLYYYKEYQESLLQLFHNVEELYIGRDITGIQNTNPYQIDYKNLKKLIIGSTSYSLGATADWKKLEYLESECLTPPHLSNVFSTSQYTTMEVRVPLESLDLYKNAPGWENFWNIKGVSETIPLRVDSEKTENARYDLSGSPVNENYKGFVIVHFSDGSTKKIMQ